MGTVKYTGPVASFHCPTNAEIRSLKVHFSPKQEGSGDPSPENVRPIVGWDGVEQYYSGKNVGHIVGYCATTLFNPYNKKIATNTYGTTLSTVDQERSVTITQSQAPETSNISHFKNGYMAIELDNLKYDETYDISFKVTNITSNPLNATLQNLGLGVPNGTRRAPTEIRNNVLIYKNISFKQRDSFPNQMDFDLRICGMSFTLSDFMVTPAGMNDGVYEPYTDKRIVKWNQWSLPLTDENWQAYNTSNNDVQFENGIATSTWLNNKSGYNSSIKTKTGILQKNKEIWYISYMVKASMAGGIWGMEYNGGLQETAVTNEEADVWYQCSRSNIYWRGTRNYVYICYYRNSITEHTGMVAQVKSPLMINLTQMFGSGNEPTKEEFEEQCALNGIDLTSALPYDEGSIREWKTNGELLKNNITFPILGKNKFNINSFLAEPSNTNLTGSRIFQPYSYCLGLTIGNSYSPDKIIDCSITNNTLTFTTTNTSYGVFFAIPSLYGTYRLSYTGENVSPAFIRYNSEGELSYSGSSLDSQGVIAIGPDVSITGVLFRSVTANTPTTVSNIQIEEGITSTEYEEFNPNHTVYGGWVDLITGEVCEEYKTIKATWGDFVLNNSTSYNDNYEHRKYTCDNSIDKSNGGSGFSNIAKKSWTDALTSSHFYIGNSAIHMFLPTGTSADLEVNIYVKLAESITYHITSTALQTFLCQNNIWSNADYVEVEYDLHETQDILARKQFIVANQPHLVSPAAASIQSFTTDLAAPLKECKVYFEPKQDLHGYDRPWVGGGGKNLFNINAPYAEPSNITSANTTNRIFTAGTHFIGIANNNYINKNAVTNASINDTTISVTATSGYGYGFALKLTPGQTYYLSGTSSSSASFTYYNSNGEVISYQGARLNKATTIPENTDITLLTFTSSGGATNTWSNIQLELGSTATSYEPYENICPIEGWDNVDVTRCGKNLFDISEMSSRNGVTVDGNTFVGSAAAIRCYSQYSYGYEGKRTPLYIPKNVPINISCTAYSEGNVSTEGAGFNPWFHYKNGGEVRPWYTRNTALTSTLYNGTITPTDDIEYYQFGWYNHSGNIWHVSNMQFEIGSEMTEYEAYNGETISVVFPATKNLFDEVYEGISGTLIYRSIYVGDNTVTASTTTPRYYTEAMPTGYSNLFILPGQVTSGAGTGANDIWTNTTRTVTPIDGYITIAYRNNSGVDPRDYHTQIEFGSTATAYEPYRTLYGGYVDLVNGEVVQEYELAAGTWRNIKYSSINSTTGYQYGRLFFNNPVVKAGMSDASKVSYCNVGKYTWNLTANATPHFYIDIIGGTETYAAYITLSSTTDDNLLITCIGKLINPIHYTLSPSQLKTLRGINNIWSNTNGNIELKYWAH